jgi:hypothetical protein
VNGVPVGEGMGLIGVAEDAGAGTPEDEQVGIHRLGLAFHVVRDAEAPLLAGFIARPADNAILGRRRVEDSQPTALSMALGIDANERVLVRPSGDEPFCGVAARATPLGVLRQPRGPAATSTKQANARHRR